MSRTAPSPLEPPTIAPESAGHLMVREVATAVVLPGDLEVFELPRREVDGSSSNAPCDVAARECRGTETCVCSALDTVAPGETGEFFTDQSAESLRAVVDRFDAAAYDPAACRRQAERFSTAQFRTRLTTYIDTVLAASQPVETATMQRTIEIAEAAG